jgi:hypothetical protein
LKKKGKNLGGVTKRKIGLKKEPKRKKKEKGLKKRKFSEKGIRKKIKYRKKF